MQCHVGSRDLQTFQNTDMRNYNYVNIYREMCILKIVKIKDGKFSAEISRRL